MRFRFFSSGAGAALTAMIVAGAPTVPTAVPETRARTLDLAVKDAADPWSRPDGSGYANDVVRAAFHAVGAEARLHVMPYARCKRTVVDDLMVGCFSMSHDSRHPDAVVFPAEPLLTNTSTLVARVTGRSAATDLKDLPRGSVVGAVLEYEYPPIIYDLERQGVIVLEYAPSELTNLRKLVAGRLDLAIVNRNEMKSLAYVAATAGVTGKVREVLDVGMLQSYVGFSRHHAQSTWARERYDVGMTTIQTNGELTRIRREWMGRIHNVTGRATFGVPPAAPPR